MLNSGRNFRCMFGLLAARCKRLAADSGNATLELALAFSFLLLPLMLATSEAAFIIYDSIEVSNAAHAGAIYGMTGDLADSATEIQNAAVADAGDVAPYLTVTSSHYYACSADMSGTQYSTMAAATVVCPQNASNHALSFVQVNTSAAVPSILQFPGLPKTWTLTGQSTMMVQD